MDAGSAFGRSFANCEVSMKKADKSERCPTCGGTNGSTVNTGRAKIQPKRVSAKPQETQADSQKVDVSDDKTADNFVEFMGNARKPRR